MIPLALTEAQWADLKTLFNMGVKAIGADAITANVLSLKQAMDAAEKTYIQAKAAEAAAPAKEAANG